MFPLRETRCQAQLLTASSWEKFLMLNIVIIRLKSIYFGKKKLNNNGTYLRTQTSLIFLNCVERRALAVSALGSAYVLNCTDPNERE